MDEHYLTESIERDAQNYGDKHQSFKAVAHPQRASHNLRFFKTGVGEYGAGDRFLGLTVPAVRALARQYRDLPLRDVASLLRSPWHEERLLALLLWVDRTRRGDLLLGMLGVHDLLHALLPDYLQQTPTRYEGDPGDMSSLATLWQEDCRENCR